MKIRLEKEKPREAKAGCVIFTPMTVLEDCAYLIAKINTKYRLIDLATGLCASKEYDSIENLMDRMFDSNQDILIYPEELALVMNKE